MINSNVPIIGEGSDEGLRRAHCMQDSDMTPVRVGDTTFGTRIGDVGPNCLLLIFGYLTGRQCGIANCVSGSWRLLLKDDLLWRNLCHKDFGLQLPYFPDGGSASSWRATYAMWSLGGFGKYGPLAPRAQRVWASLRRWTSLNLPEVGNSLRPGVTEAQLEEAEASLGFPLPLAVRASYRFCNGQQLHIDTCLESQAAAEPHGSMLHGLFGGYAFYDHVVSTRLLPLHRLVSWTKKLRNHMAAAASVDSTLVLIAASFLFNKLVVVDSASTEVRVCLQDKRTSVPGAAATPGEGGGMLQWLEEFAVRVASRRFRVITESSAGIPATLSLSLLDCSLPAASEAVTNGVRIIAMAVFVPEHSRLLPETPALSRYFFSYSIRFSLLSVVDQKASGVRKPIKFAQLRSRHWIVRNSLGEIQNRVDGNGVVGEFPIIKAGTGDYSYSSCTTQAEPQGFMEGYFVFSHGPTSHPTGADLQVQCSRFALVVPTFIY